jgi:hypothetical protein
MQLVYGNAQHTIIKVMLDADEAIGPFSGPVEAFVPTDPNNVHFAEIVKQALPIEDYITDVPVKAAKLKAAKPASKPASKPAPKPAAAKRQKSKTK